MTVTRVPTVIGVGFLLGSGMVVILAGRTRCGIPIIGPALQFSVRGQSCARRGSGAMWRTGVVWWLR